MSKTTTSARYTNDDLLEIAVETADQLVTVRFTDGTDLTVVSAGRTSAKGFGYRHAMDITPVDLDQDGYTSAALAAIFDTNAKALRVVLRAMGLGVGKGQRYNLRLDETLRSNIKARLAESA
jgi:hypothetical protein